MGKMSNTVERLFWSLAVIGLSLLTVSDWFPEIPLIFEIALSFKPELIIVLAILFLLSLLRRKILFAAILVILLLIQGTELVSTIMPNDLSRTHNEFMHRGSSLKVMMLNLHYGNKNLEAFRALIQQEQPDVIFALEVVGPWVGELDLLRPQYPNFVPSELPEGLQVRLLSKVPLVNQEMLGLSDPLRPVLSAKILLDGHELRIIAAHLSAPMFQERFELRNAQLNRLAELINGEKLPTLVLGDMNITRWSPYFKRFVQRSELVDARLGRGLLNSWRPFGNSIPIFRAPIDQILYTPDLRLSGVRLGADIGSDHLPMIAEVNQRYARDQNFYQQLRTSSPAQ